MTIALVGWAGIAVALCRLSLFVYRSFGKGF